MIASYSEAVVMAQAELEEGDLYAAAVLAVLAIDALSRDTHRCSRLGAAQRRLGRTFAQPHRNSRVTTALSRAILHRRGSVRVHQQADATQVMVRLRLGAVAIGAAMAASLTTPAMAESRPSTRLVSCGTDSCLLVTGRRQSGDAEVRINGHPVVVQGERSWRVRLPVATVREWSAPFARKIEVSSYNPAMSVAASHSAKLPIGLLGHVPDLASLVITLN